MPSKPPVQAAPMLAACSSSAIVHSVSISSVSPCVRSSTRPLARPMSPATSAPASRPENGSFQPRCMAIMPAV